MDSSRGGRGLADVGRGPEEAEKRPLGREMERERDGGREEVAAVEGGRGGSQTRERAEGSECWVVVEGKKQGSHSLRSEHARAWRDGASLPEGEGGGRRGSHVQDMGGEVEEEEKEEEEEEEREMSVGPIFVVALDGVES